MKNKLLLAASGIAIAALIIATRPLARAKKTLRQGRSEQERETQPRKTNEPKPTEPTIETMRRIYGRSFAAGYAPEDKVEKAAGDLCDLSLVALVRDREERRGA